jgi:hypothetical protein
MRSFPERAVPSRAQPVSSRAQPVSSRAQRGISFRTRSLVASLLGMTLVLAGCGLAGTSNSTAKLEGDDFPVFEGPLPRATCGPGSRPEPDLQGRVPFEHRQRGPNGEPADSESGYTCNLELVGQEQNQGASWQAAWYEDCAYYGTVFTGGTSGPNPNMGVQVIDVSNPANPGRTAALQTPAMLDPWESLKTNDKRGLLGAVASWNVAGPVYIDIYDVKGDCTQPELLSSTPMNVPLGHEGNWAPDGMTYYSGTFASAIDVSNPQLPVYIPRSNNAGSGHGLSLSDDGNRMYAVNGTGAACDEGNGLTIFDTSEVQARKPNPAMPIVGEVCWIDGATAQHTIPIFYNGRPFILFVDELGKGAARIIDISDERNPYVVSKLKLEIHQDEYEDLVALDTAGNGAPFRYEAHYCGVDRTHNPTAAACGYFQSGIRVFDIRDPYKPREIAYFNPPAQIGQNDRLRGSEHAHGYIASTGALGGTPGEPPNLSADWCSAYVRLIPERGELWTTCQDNGFLVLRFTNGVWPFATKGAR